MGKGTKKRAIKSKGTVRTSEAEAEDLDPDIDEGAMVEKIERAQITPVLPDALVRMRQVVLALEVLGLLFIL